MSSSFSKENLELLDIAKLIATSTMAIAEAFEESDQSAHAAFQAIRTELDHVREQLKLLVDSPESKAESLWVNRKMVDFSFFLLLLPPVLNLPLLSTPIFQEFKRAGLQLFLSNFPCVVQQ